MAKPGLSPNARAIITSKLTKPIDAARLTAERQLHDALGSTSGSGVQYRGLPNRSSAPGENPTRQSGRLQGMVGSEMVSETSGRVGMFPQTEDEAKQARALEYGYDPNNLEGRAYLQRTFEDPQNRQEIRDAAIKAGRGQ